MIRSCGQADVNALTAASSDGELPLTELRVIGYATLLAGPVIALLADFGADVIKSEHPRLGSVQDAEHGSVAKARRPDSSGTRGRSSESTTRRSTSASSG